MNVLVFLFLIYISTHHLPLLAHVADHSRILTPKEEPDVPKRICQTCGQSLTLDHFVSLYTESSTANCDVCRQKQREIYRCIDLFYRLMNSKAD